MLRTLALVALTFLFNACAHTQHAEPAPRAEPAGGMQVVALQWAAAPELERELNQVLGGAKHRGLKVVADPRTNSLIVVAESQEDLARALELIARLDVRTPSAH